MDGTANITEVDNKRRTISTSVPDSDIAKLTYYLSCVCTTIDCDKTEDICRFTNYINCGELSNEDQKLLLNICYTFSPDLFEDKVFFHNRELCMEFSNEFYDINQVRQQLSPAELITVADRTYPVKKVMVYKMSWMQKNYLEPIHGLEKQLS